MKLSIRMGHSAICRLVVCLALVFYQAFFFKSFYPVTEGWFSTYAHLIRMGKVPYADFHLLLPPLYPFQLALFQSVFGESILALRYLGIVVVCGIGVALFEILRSLFNCWVAAFSAVSALIYYQSGNAFIGYDFTQFVTLYLLIGGVLLIRYTEAQLSSDKVRRQSWVLAAAGLFLGMATLIKQSNGGMTALVVGTATFIVILRTNPRRRALRQLFWFAGGGSLPILLTLLWLAARGALGAFWTQTVTEAAAAKGGGRVIFFNWILNVFTSDQYLHQTWMLLMRLAGILTFVIGATSIAVLAIAIVRRERPSHRALLAVLSGSETYPQGRIDRCAIATIGVAFAALGIIFLAIYRDYCSFCTTWKDHLANIYNGVIPGALNLYLVGGIVALVTFLPRPRSANGRLLIVFLLGTGLTVGNGTSAGLSEISAFLGLGIGEAFLIQLGVPYILPALIPVALSLSVSAYFIERKFESPYHWWSTATSDIRRLNCADADGLLVGLCIEPTTYANIVRITQDIVTNSDPPDAIYVYPHEPIFYLLSHREPFAGAVVSWFDFMSNAEALALDSQLATQPPRVIVFTRLPDLVVTTHERLFNGGQPLAQRRLVATVNELAKDGVIRLVDRVDDLDGLAVEIYVRSESPR